VNTITGSDWAAALPAARARRAPVAVRARVFSGPICPVCGLPGIHREMLGGVRIIHGPDSCWMPTAAALGAAGLVGGGTRLGMPSPQLVLVFSESRASTLLQQGRAA
jgi:hypothetical protein